MLFQHVSIEKCQYFVMGYAFFARKTDNNDDTRRFFLHQVAQSTWDWAVGNGRAHGVEFTAVSGTGVESPKGSVSPCPSGRICGPRHSHREAKLGVGTSRRSQKGGQVGIDARTAKLEGKTA